MSKETTTALAETRICRTCKAEKANANFYKDSRYPGGDIHCSDCRKAKVKAWREANPERAKDCQRRSREKNPDASRERARKWHANNRERHLVYMAERRRAQPMAVKNSALKSQFGITIEDYQRIFEKQGGVCAICQKTPQQNGKRLAVDHCHRSSQVRGLLCSTCNQALGLFKDKIEFLKAAISYLETA
jgi:uncharacterized Zn finger protein (UPF0148 family)